MPLPVLPSWTIELLEELPAAPPGFLGLRRQRMRLRYDDGSQSVPFVYDTVERRALDAVVLVAHYRDESGCCCVYLRSAIRPPIAMAPRGVRVSPGEPGASPLASVRSPLLWELPAGLVEPDEQGEPGWRRCAARELREELGFVEPEASFRPLGPSLYAEPGMIGEQHHYFEIVVDPTQRRPPLEDGSVLEQRGMVAAVALDEALALVASGVIVDAKTELALRRLADRVLV